MKEKTTKLLKEDIKEYLVDFCSGKYLTRTQKSIKHRRKLMINWVTLNLRTRCQKQIKKIIRNYRVEEDIFNTCT